MKNFVFLGLILFLSLKSHAYPEMIRHGYVNCLACHTSQQGGDMLSEYGRELGKELFFRNDSLFAQKSAEKNYWTVKTPEWLSLGANVRLLQTMTESSVASKGRFMIMQVDVDSRFQIAEGVIAYASLGRYEPAQAQTDWKDFVYVPRLWAQYARTYAGGSATASLRLGRFYPTYGVNIAEHTYVNRRALDFNPGQERVAAEVNWSNENYQASVSTLFQRAQYQKYDPESGYVVQVSKVLGKTARLGFNTYRSSLKQGGVTQEKSIDGVFALVGWKTDFSLLLQADRISMPNGKTGFLDFLKFGYEYTQGIQLFLTQEYLNLNTEKTDPHLESYGVGVQYFPFANFDLFATYKKTKDSAQLNEYQDVLWLIAHIYF